MHIRRVRHSAAAASILLLAACAEPVERERSWEAMGATTEAIVYTRLGRDADRALDEIENTLAKAAVTLDPLSDEGQLGELNAAASDGFYRLSSIDVYACIRLSLDYARESQGAYDPTVGALIALWSTRLAAANPPGQDELDLALFRVGWEKVVLEPEAMAIRFLVPGLRLDLGPVARGCALDWAARTFARPGSLAGLIRLGGIYRAWESPPGEKAWRVSLADPRRDTVELLSIRVANRGVAVCGQREGAGTSTAEELSTVPTLDPRTGAPVASDLLAVVTTADSSADAAALCQAMFVAGSLSAPDLFRKLQRVEAVLLVRADEGHPYLLASASLRGRIEPSDELAQETAGEVRYLLPPESF